MVVLVRNIDNTYTLALEARLDELIDDGLISSFLHEGEWVKVDRKLPRHMYAQSVRADRGMTAMVSSF
jgi:low affinity Fe/Cu permease